MRSFFYGTQSTKLGAVLLLATLAGVCIVAGNGGQETAAMQSDSATGTIAFVRDGNIWLIAPDGTNEQKLTGSGKCSHPSWSADGSFLTFSSGGDIWTMKVAAPAQLVYLILFSYTFFFTGYTGLSLTVGAIVTLAILMQVTAKVDWERLQPVRSAPAPPPPPPG